MEGQVNQRGFLRGLSNSYFKADVTAQVSQWLQEALFTRKADAYFNPLIQAFAPSYGLSARYQQARVLAITPLHNNAVLLRIQTPMNWSGFKPGQYISCEFEINGVRRKRNYSICSSLQDFEKTSCIEINVHRVDGGLVSNFVIDELRLNTLFFISEAMGEFGIELTHTSNKPVLMLAAGSGITPFVSILGSAQQNERAVQLIYSCSKSDEHLFQEEWMRLQNGNKNLAIHLHTTQQNKNDKRLDVKQIQALCVDVQEREIFICGSHAYTQNMIQCLTNLGVSASAIHIESFDSLKVVGSAAQQASVNFSRSEKHIQINNDTSLLEQAEQLGLNPKSGCRMGVCHSCTCTKKSGVVRNMLTGELSASDEEEIRICISQAVGEVDIAL